MPRTLIVNYCAGCGIPASFSTEEIDECYCGECGFMLLSLNAFMPKPIYTVKNPMPISFNEPEPPEGAGLNWDSYFGNVEGYFPKLDKSKMPLPLTTTESREVKAKFKPDK